MKKKLTIISRKKGDPIQRGKTKLSKTRNLSDKNIQRQALSDENNLPLTPLELAQLKAENIQ